MLEAGGAYVPLDPGTPGERIAYILEDSKVEVVIVKGEPVAEIRERARTIDLDQEREPLALNLYRSQGATTSNLAYIIYTSGTTGKPKGIGITHHNILRLFTTTATWYQFHERSGQDTWALFHSFAFDVSVWEIWGSMLFGGRLVVVPYMVSRSTEDFYRLLVDEGVTVLNQTPPPLNNW